MVTKLFRLLWGTVLFIALRGLNSLIKLCKLQNNYSQVVRKVYVNTYVLSTRLSGLISKSIIENSIFIPVYYNRNDLIWADGFLIDFLQKKSADMWIRKFVIYSGFLFSENLVFNFVVRLYLDKLIWPLHENSFIEADNTFGVLSVTIFLYFLFFSLLLITTAVIF